MDLASADKLKTLIRNVSRSRLTQQGLAENVQIKEVDGRSTVLSHWMAIILISGRSGVITFKTHFKTRNAKLLAAPLYGQPPEQVSSLQAIDCIREFCNLTAGGVKRSLLTHMETHLSLPVVTRGFDEIYFRAHEGDGFSDRWRLAYRDNELICTVHINFRDEVDFTQLDVDAGTEAENTTQVEFL